MAKASFQIVTATHSWRLRMAKARAVLKELNIGQQDVLVWITDQKSTIDRLTYATRWRNAWLGKVADPEFTELVENATNHFLTKE